MDAPINRLPSGFLGMVDVKSMGKNPRSLHELVQPTLDMTRWYSMSQRVRRAFTTVAPAGPGTTYFAAGGPNSNRVPENKCWLVESYFVAVVGLIPAAVTAYSVSCIVGDQNLSVLYSGPPGQSYVTGEGGIIATLGLPNPPYIALPLWSFGANIQRCSGGGAPIITGEITFLEVDL